jgi:mxaJ protein
MVYGDYRDPAPSARIVEAVADRSIDIAVVWGPLAGYFVQHQPVSLTITPIEAGPLDAGLPYAFDIAMGVRRSDTGLRDRINAALPELQPRIDAILAQYHVPRDTQPPS